jgi:TonB-dependent receptor
MNHRYPAPLAAKACPTSLRLSFRTRARFAAALALAASATTLWADGRVAGRVIDAATQSGLPGAEITVAGSTARAVTASDGAFTLNLPAGEYELSSYYLGYPSQTVSVTVTDDTTTPARFALGSADDVITLDAFVVEGTREGQARALNQQRTSTNLTNIISSDLSGQFPDKTVADAVKRLPGITVETDTDTGGSEGRYITIRGMNADFNAVSVNGMRVAVSDFSGASRRVPLDVVSAKSADQIEVTKALRPDQDGDGIGGAVNIITRSPFDSESTYAFAEGALSYSKLLADYSGDYPYENPGYEASAGWSSTFGKENQYGLAISANRRERSFVKQRVSTTGWARNIDTDDFVGRDPYFAYDGVLQDFFDDVESTGVTGTLEWRPSDDSKLRLDVSHSQRDTERGRQRKQYTFFEGAELEPSTVSGDTYTDVTLEGRVQRQVRQFFEEQAITNATLSGESTRGPWTIDFFTGVNHGTFDGDPDKDISATFRSGIRDLRYQRGDDTYTPTFSSDFADNDPAQAFRYSINGASGRAGLDRSTSFVTDDEFAGGLNAKREADILGGEGFWKFGAKGRFYAREYDFVSRRFDNPTAGTWTLANQPGIASYGPSGGIVDGNYDFGYYLDPELIRNTANTLALTPRADDAARSAAQSYEATEDIVALYGMGQSTWGKFTAMAGARGELSRVNFQGFNADLSTGSVLLTDEFDVTESYFNILPGIHVRYDQTRNWIHRASITTSIARPRLSDLNPREEVDDVDEIITRGNINLDPTQAINVDLGTEYYFDQAGVVSFGLFLKEIQDPIYTGRSVINDPANPLDGYRIVQSQNAESAWVRGFEVAYDQQFTFLPAPFDAFGAFANYTFADSEVDTGLPEFDGVDLPLFNQVENTVNFGLFYNKHDLLVRTALIYRSGSLIDIQTDQLSGDYDPRLSRYMDESLTLDVTASYRFAKNWTVFVEFQNLLNEPGRAYNGNEALRLDYNEYTDWSANLGLRWSL